MGTKVALLIHGLGSGPLMYEVSPNGVGGIKQVLEKKGIDTIVPTLPGHCQSYRTLAQSTGEEWLSLVKKEIHRLITNEEIEEIYLIGFSLGGLLTLLACHELFSKEPFTRTQLSRVHLLVANTPVYIRGVPTSLLKKISTWPRSILEWLPIPNIPRPNEPNRSYLKKVLISKFLPLSIVVEMMRLVWSLPPPSFTDRFQELKGLVLVQAVPDGVVDPKSVEFLRERVGGKVRVIKIPDATHALPEEKAWEQVTKVLEENIH